MSAAITVWPSKREATGGRPLPWSALRPRLERSAQRVVASRDELPAIGLFETRDGHRCDESVTKLHAIALDHDGSDTAPTPVDVAIEWLRRTGRGGLAYETPRSSADAPRWRLVLPLAAPWTVPAEWSEVYERFRVAMESEIGVPFDPQCKNPSRFYFPPARLHNDDPPRRVEEVAGEPLDLETWALEHPAPQRERPAPPPHCEERFNADGTRYGRAALEGLCAELAACGQGGRDVLALRVLIRGYSLELGGELTPGTADAEVRRALEANGYMSDPRPDRGERGLARLQKSARARAKPEAAPERFEAPATRERPPAPTDADAPGARAATGEKPAPVPSYTLAEFLAVKLPPRRYLLEPIIRERDLAMLFAKTGFGKSFVAHAIAVAVAGGGRFLEWQAPEPRNVLLVDGELPTATLQERLRQAVALIGVDVGDRLRIVAADTIEDGLRSLATDEGRAALDPHVAGADLVMLDNIATLCPGGLGVDPNSVQSWATIQPWALSLRRRGKGVFFVDHAGNNPDRFRGTTSKSDVLDLVIGLKRPSDYVATQGLRVELTFEKARGLHGAAVDPLEVSLTTDPYSNAPTWAYRSLDDTRRARALEMKDGGMSQAAIAAEMGIHQSTVSRWLRGEK